MTLSPKTAGTAQKKTAILKSFLTDASLLCAQGQECVSQLMEQAKQKRVSPAQIHALHQAVHTIKGTASMVEGGDAIVRALHALESRLSSESITESAERFDWLTLARTSLSETQLEISRLQRKEKFAPLIPMGPTDGASQAAWEQRLGQMLDVQVDPSLTGPKGICAIVIYEGQSRLYWFALSALNRVWQAEEIAQQEALCVRGCWVPIIGEQVEIRFGFGLKAKAGQIVVVVQDVVAIDSWERARSCGAVDGVEVFLNPLEISRAS